MADLPAKIHRYEVIDRLGRGGMGELYLAKDPLLDRLVAIKVLRTGFEGSDLRERFAREARSAARLAHVNIVTIYDVGDHDGQPYIAMEYVRGETLYQQIQRKLPLPLSTKLQYIDELCAGLAHAHKSGIVHRDIKPANLIISSDGALKILDFGIARLADSNMTQEGSVMGTLNYMSPEQLTGQPIDHRSDVWAVGAVFYELLTYQQAFPGEINTGVLSRIIEAKYKPLQEVAARVDRSLARLVERALSRDHTARFADLKEMREELTRVRQRMDSRSLAALTATASNADTIAIDTPLSTPRTPRSGAKRDEIQRRRAEELAGYLNAARQAFAAARYEEAAAACERALILDDESEEAIELSERAREAIEQGQVREWLGEARDEFDHGNLTRARELVSRVFSLEANSPAAAALRVAIEQADRQRHVEEILGRGRAALASGDYGAANEAAREALEAEPSSPDAVALRRDIEVALAAEQRRAEEERTRAEHERRAQEVIPYARERFDSGDMDGAIALLEAFSPPHADVSAMLEDLRTEARVIREREAERQRQLQAELAQARKAIGESEITAAVSAVARARGIAPADPQVAELARAIEAKRAELAARRKAEEEARRKAELEARRKAEEAARRKADEEKRRREREQADREAAAAAKRQAEEDARRRVEEERQRKVQEELRRKVEEGARRKTTTPDTVVLGDKTVVIAPKTPAVSDTRPLAAPPIAPPLPPPVPRPSGQATIEEGSKPTPLIGLAAAAVLLLAILGGGAYWLLGGDDASPQSGQSEPQAGTGGATADQPAANSTGTATNQPAAEANAVLVIDAAPWAEIVEVTGANGRVNVTAKHTPLALSVPEGEYRVTLRNPSESAPKVVTTKVTAATPGRAFAEFAPVDVDDYFRRAGS